MSFFEKSVTSCRFCQHYDPVGRRGGNCKVLDVQVVGNWEACSLAKPMFNSLWQEADQKVRVMIAKDEKRKAAAVSPKSLEQELLESEPAC